MPEPSPNQSSEELDQYIIDAIVTDFPMFKVKEVVDRELQDPKTLVGLVKSEGDRAYTFCIDLDNPRPILQAY